MKTVVKSPDPITRLTFAILLTLLPFVLVTLSCTPTDKTPALEDTQAALDIQSTLNAEKELTLQAQQTESAAQATKLLQQDSVQATVQAQQATMDVQNTSIAQTAAVPVEQPTEASVQPAATDTPTSLSSPSGAVKLEDWKMTRFMPVNSGCYLPDALCWKSDDKYPFDQIGAIDPALTLREGILIDSSWPKPYLVFWQDYDFVREAQISVQVDSKWQAINVFKTGKKSWHQLAVDLSRFKGQTIIIRLSAGGMSSWTDKKNVWFVQDLQIVPNYTP
jgi:hypothetical protein